MITNKEINKSTKNENLIFIYLNLYAFLIGALRGSIVQPVMTSPLHGEDPGFESLWTHFTIVHY